MSPNVAAGVSQRAVIKVSGQFFSAGIVSGVDDEERRGEEDVDELHGWLRVILVGLVVFLVGGAEKEGGQKAR